VVLPTVIGLAVPGRPIGPWSRRTGAPKASATGRDRNPDAHELAHETVRELVRHGNTGWDMEAVSLQLKLTRVGLWLRGEKGLQRLRA
jgi:hypothetical protein